MCIALEVHEVGFWCRIHVTKGSNGVLICGLRLTIKRYSFTIRSVVHFVAGGLKKSAPGIEEGTMFLIIGYNFSISIE